MNAEPITRIVVGVDFSRESELAVEHALSIARHLDAAIVLVHAKVIIERSDVPPRLSDSYATIAELHQTHVREQLAEIRERHGGQGVDISHVLIDGYADSALEEAAAEMGAGLIAVGTHGRTGVKRFFLGSVAEKVVRVASRDVLVARPGHSAGGYQRILVPTDFSPLAELALQRATELAAAGATIDLFHCRPHPFPIYATYYPVGESAMVELDEAQAAAAEGSAEALVARYARDGIELRYDSAESAPAEAIIERAAGYDLVAIGSHGRRGLRRFMLGSVAEATVRHSPCSVLVTHQS